MANASELPAKLTINPGSGGFGVPRGSLNRLDHYSRTIDRNSRPLSVVTERPIQVREGGFGMEPGMRGSVGGRPSMTMATPTSHSGPAQTAGPHK